jgi:hypothetical protein
MFERLRSLSVWYGDEEAIDDETAPDGVPRLLMSWYEPPPPPHPEDWRALGFLYLDDGRLAADVATRAIAERLMGEINARLGSAATLVEAVPASGSEYTFGRTRCLCSLASLQRPGRRRTTMAKLSGARHLLFAILVPVGTAFGYVQPVR